jgi:hypothetical protein
LLAGAALFVALISQQHTLWMIGVGLAVLGWVWLPRERVEATHSDLADK